MTSSADEKLQAQVEKPKKKSRRFHTEIIFQEQLEEHLLLACKMKALASLAGGIAHDFNNVLQAILGHTQLALMSKTEDDPDYKTFTEIEEIVKRGGELTDRFLAIGRKIRPQFVPLDLNDCILNVEKLLRRSFPKMIKFKLELAKDLNRVHADTGQMEQVLINLCTNARDAMVNGGTLKITTEKAADSGSLPVDKGSTASGKVCLKVSDTGCGIPSEIKGHIFKPDFSAGSNGKDIGLGLLMVHAIVKNHGGTIECTSEAGAGTEFKIFFPALMPKEALSKKSVQPQNSRRRSRGKETILMVDDEVEILHIGKDFLERHGYQVVTAQSGEDALNLYSANSVDSVILDVGMPGMSGLTCLKELLAKNESAKVMISSGDASDDHVTEALNLGAKAFLSKPYRIKSLLETVRQVMDEPQ